VVLDLGDVGSTPRCDSGLRSGTPDASEMYTEADESWWYSYLPGISLIPLYLLIHPPEMEIFLGLCSLFSQHCSASCIHSPLKQFVHLSELQFDLETSRATPALPLAGSFRSLPAIQVPTYSWIVCIYIIFCDKMPIIMCPNIINPPFQTLNSHPTCALPDHVSGVMKSPYPLSLSLGGVES